VTFSAGVPTVWLGVINHVKAKELKISSTSRRTVIGGAACPPAMMRTLENEYNVEVIHAWGMTELSPLGTLSKLKAKHARRCPRKRSTACWRSRAARSTASTCASSATTAAAAWDGVASGDLLVRGCWVIDSYFGRVDKSLREVDGASGSPPGDVATIDADGFMQITDRSKDVIKSGGEWISSIDLENIAMAHPAVLEAAVIACRHPKWDERPLLVVVKKPDAELRPRGDAGLLRGQALPRWQIPDDVVFVDEIPHTATGKMLKLKLREQFRDHKLPTA
jgi:acyl-CoA synthetase (AMP-forming)/AMP-acid ligase II